VKKKIGWLERVLIGDSAADRKEAVLNKPSQEKIWKEVPYEERLRRVEKERAEKNLRKKAEQEKRKKRLRNKKRSSTAKNRHQESVAGSGSGFLINNNGLVLTNHHVVGSSKQVKIRTSNKTYNGKVIAKDAVNDLAIIKINLKGNKFLQISKEDPSRLDNIITAGFPYGDTFSDHVKSTTGTVNALVGPGNNSSQMQISAPIQPGNSGGPVIDTETGSFVGVAVSKLDAKKFMEQYDSIPENVNFAIKSSTIKRFLKSNKKDFTISEKEKITKKELNDLIDSAVLFITN
tara:strand:- start:148 stop:1017 length:870 start_codon:yes stop_codon:yes gene_type:complete